MKLLDLIDCVMRPAPGKKTSAVRVSAQHDVWAANAQIERMRRDIDALDVTVRAAEARLHPHGHLAH